MIFFSQFNHNNNEWKSALFYATDFHSLIFFSFIHNNLSSDIYYFDKYCQHKEILNHQMSNIFQHNLTIWHLPQIQKCSICKLKWKKVFYLEMKVSKVISVFYLSFNLIFFLRIECLTWNYLQRMVFEAIENKHLNVGQNFIRNAQRFLTIISILMKYSLCNQYIL